MLERLKANPNYFEFYDLDTMPQTRDCFLIGTQDIEEIEQQWANYADKSNIDTEWRHPNELTDYISCHLLTVGNLLNIHVLLNRSDRWHKIHKVIPKEKIEAAFLPFTSEKRPTIVVQQEWFDWLLNRLYSSYAMIDFAGIRELLMTHGEFPVEKLRKIKGVVDKSSTENPDMLFLSAADNIIIKSSWSPNDELRGYNPEKLVAVVTRIMELIKSSVDISSYAIFTQGTNYVDDIGLQQEQSPANHFFVSSISTPFMEAFEIDEEARRAIRNKEIEKSDVYLEKSYYDSLNRSFRTGGEPEWFTPKTFLSAKLKTEITYIPLKVDRMEQLIKDEKRA